jgi:hypothetical protein
MELPEDLGRRIVEAASLALTLHLQQSLIKELCSKEIHPGGTGAENGGASIQYGGAIIPIGRADQYGTNATDGVLRADPLTPAGADCEAA